MSADHTITTKNRTEEIAETTQKLLHDYFERSGSASLINRLAPDVLWFSEEESGGKEEAARYLTAWKEGGRGQKVGPIDRGVRRSIYVFA